MQKWMSALRCLKAFHQLSSNPEVMKNMQNILYNTSSDFVAWFFKKGIRSELQAKDDKKKNIL